MAQETTLLILGASGDLTSRLLLPAIGQLMKREPDRTLALRGAGSDDWSQARWEESVRTAFASSGAADQLPRVKDTVYTRADVTDRDALAALVEGVQGRLVVYFALPPAVTIAACEVLRDVQLPGNTVLALEKPFGADERSARELNALVQSLVPEERIFRVDHFLGRSTLLNVLGVRFANRLIEPVWSADHVQSVLVRYDGALAV